jgi:hypothetical protein
MKIRPLRRIFLFQGTHSASVRLRKRAKENGRSLPAIVSSQMTKKENFCDGYALAPNKKIQARA